MSHCGAHLPHVPVRPGWLPKPQDRVLAREGAALALPGSFLDRAGENAGGLAWSEEGPVGLEVSRMHRRGHHLLFLDFSFDHNFHICRDRVQVSILTSLSPARFTQLYSWPLLRPVSKAQGSLGSPTTASA